VRLVVLLFTIGCYDPSSTLDCPPGGCDAPPKAATCVGGIGGFVTETCFDGLAAQVFAAPATIDTDDPLRCADPVTPDPRFCFIAGERIQIESSIEVRGSRPLVLWAADEITIGAAGVLDVAGHVGDTTLAAGANDASCASGLDGAGDIGLDVGTGGCGGPFATDAGNGGNAARNGAGVVVSACDAIPVTPIDRLRGGCRGGHGGFSSTNGGNSGGAVYLMAGSAITVRGQINASGGGAAGTPVDAMVRQGGGGGGSGGMIAFDAPKVILEDAILLALGGGGGSGTGDAAGARDGKPGTDPMLNPSAAFATGSGQTVNTNFGGDSPLAGGTTGGNTSNVQTGGGGGGGGGHGLILVFPNTVVPTGTYFARPEIPQPPA
jgi:hypothetical protein